VVEGADVFLGCSAAGVLTPRWSRRWRPSRSSSRWPTRSPRSAPRRRQGRAPDCIIATGRSDYPNQVNNVLCFPYIFRGALDCGATKITEEMKLACVREIAELAKAEQRRGGRGLRRARSCASARLHHPHAVRLAPDPAHRAGRGAAAAEVGVATRPIADLEAYREKLTRFVYQTGMIMRPLFTACQGEAGTSASPMPKARTTACCAPRRSCSTRSSPSRS
jgi:malate dehydrogenase (oxaloacetate-decarboxylating)(NADP+)